MMSLDLKLSLSMSRKSDGVMMMSSDNSSD